MTLDLTQVLTTLIETIGATVVAVYARKAIEHVTTEVVKTSVEKSRAQVRAAELASLRPLPGAVLDLDLESLPKPSITPR